MRPFEMLMMAAIGVSLGCVAALPVTAHAGSAALLAFCLAIALLILHLMLEGVHWQLGPAYLAFFTAGMLLWRARHGHWSWLWEAAGLLMLILCCGFAYAVPMFRLPVPTGRFATGTSILHMVDTSRLEDAMSQAGGMRELMVQLWYPAVAATGVWKTRKLACYRRKEETSLVSSYQALIRTHSYLNAHILRNDDGPYPVLIFNPAWRGRRTQNTFLTEELASHGYMVAAIDHTYNSRPVAFPDGRIVTAEPVDLFETPADTNPDDVKRIGNKEADKQAQDVRFVLDELSRMNQEQGSRWFQSMDTANAGAFGHSFGGGVSMQAWATDARIKAAMNMDGWSFGSRVKQGTRAVEGQLPSHPLLFLYRGDYFISEPGNGVESTLDADDHDHVCQLLRQYGGYWMRLKGANHPTFTDRVITSPIRRLSGAAEICPRRAHEVLRACAVAFFDHAFGRRSSVSLQDELSNYPETMEDETVATRTMRT